MENLERLEPAKLNLDELFREPTEQERFLDQVNGLLNFGEYNIDHAGTDKDFLCRVYIDMLELAGRLAHTANYGGEVSDNIAWKAYAK